MNHQSIHAQYYEVSRYLIYQDASNSKLSYPFHQLKDSLILSDFWIKQSQSLIHLFTLISVDQTMWSPFQT